MTNHPTPHLRLAGVLLVVGWISFWAGAATPPYRWWQAIPVSEYLGIVADHRGAWLWIALAFTVGVVSTLGGLVALGPALDHHGGRVWGALGQALLLAGSVLWLASIAFRATATVAAANELAVSGTVPGWFEPMRAWSGAIFAVYMVLAYLAIAAYGQALRSTTLAPRWLARAHVFFGLLGALGFTLRVPVFSPPLMIPLLPGILGLGLLLKR